MNKSNLRYKLKKQVACLENELPVFAPTSHQFEKEHISMVPQQLSLFKEEPFPPDALSSRERDRNTEQSKISAEDILKPNLMELIHKLESIVLDLKNISK